jgi:hypothetical protein
MHSHSPFKPIIPTFTFLQNTANFPCLRYRISKSPNTRNPTFLQQNVEYFLGVLFQWNVVLRIGVELYWVMVDIDICISVFVENLYGIFLEKLIFLLFWRALSQLVFRIFIRPLANFELLCDVLEVGGEVVAL